MASFPSGHSRSNATNRTLQSLAPRKLVNFKSPLPQPARGVAWIRLHDNHSATSLIPILIESNPVLSEVEPNEGLKQAIAAALPTTAIGKLERNGDVDLWKISLRTGDQLVATLIANEIIQSRWTRCCNWSTTADLCSLKLKTTAALTLSWFSPQRKMAITSCVSSVFQKRQLARSVSQAEQTSFTRCD